MCKYICLPNDKRMKVDDEILPKAKGYPAKFLQIKQLKLIYHYYYNHYDYYDPLYFHSRIMSFVREEKIVEHNRCQRIFVIDFWGFVMIIIGGCLKRTCGLLNTCPAQFIDLCSRRKYQISFEAVACCIRRIFILIFK